MYIHEVIWQSNNFYDAIALAILLGKTQIVCLFTIIYRCKKNKRKITGYNPE